MPQLEGQPGSRGMNPPGGISTINLYNWSEPTQSAPQSRRNNQSNDEEQRVNDNNPTRASAGLSPWPDNNRGITRMHQAPGGTSTITFGVPSSPAENDASVKRRPGYDEKRKELYGSGIFNETSGSSDGDAGYGGFADKVPATGDNQETRYRPASDAKAKELNGSNIFGYTNYDSRPPSGRSVQDPDDQGYSQQQHFNNNNNALHGAIDETEYGQSNHLEGTKQGGLSAGLSVGNENSGDNAGRLSFSNAKAREMAGDNIFGPSPSDPGKIAAHNREPAGKRSQLMRNNEDLSEHPDPYGQKKHEMKSAELSGNNIFHGRSNNPGDDMPQYQQRSSAKVREMSGSDIFSNDQPKARNTVGGIRKPPGGGSTIMLA